MTDAVNWKSYDGEGDFVERFLCTLLHQRYPTGIHRRPSKGDGGIDFHVRLDNGRYLVFQIKSFTTGHLTDSRKSQIKNSLAKAKTLSPAPDEWHLLMAMNPTSELEAWWDEITKDAPFECFWDAVPFCDTIAAENPIVVDYFSGDGKNRYIEIFEQSRILMDGLLPTEPSQAVEPVEVLANALNDLSPFYRFEVSMHGGGTPAEVAAQTAHLFSTPKVVMWRTLVISSDVAITLVVKAKYPQATEDEPIFVTMELDHTQLADAEGEAAVGQPVPVTGIFTTALPGEEPEVFQGHALIGPHGQPVKHDEPLKLAVRDSEGGLIDSLELPAVERFDGITAVGLKAVSSCKGFEVSWSMQGDRVRINFQTKIDDWSALSARLLSNFFRRAHISDANLSLEVGDGVLVGLSEDDGIVEWIGQIQNWMESIHILAELSYQLEKDFRVPSASVCSHDVFDLREALALVNNEPIPAPAQIGTQSVPIEYWQQMSQWLADDTGGTIDQVIQFNDPVWFKFHQIEEQVEVDMSHMHMRRYDYAIRGCYEEGGERFVQIAWKPTDESRTFFHRDNGTDGKICGHVASNDTTW